MDCSELFHWATESVVAFEELRKSLIRLSLLGAVHLRQPVDQGPQQVPQSDKQDQSPQPKPEAPVATASKSRKKATPLVLRFLAVSAAPRRIAEIVTGTGLSDASVRHTLFTNKLTIKRVARGVYTINGLTAQQMPEPPKPPEQAPPVLSNATLVLGGWKQVKNCISDLTGIPAAGK